MYGDSRRSFSDKERRSPSRGYDSRGPKRRSFNDPLSPMVPSLEPITFTKNFYSPTKTLSSSQARELMEKSQMRVNGNDIPLPVSDFDSLGFPQEVVDYFLKKGFTSPTAIQAQGWPMALSGRDMVGIADTGSGKTISFVLPALIHAKAQQPLREGDGPIVLILAPTRELCLQIRSVVAEYEGFFDLKSLAVYGGASAIPQKSAITKGIQILVATPGRLIDLNEQGFCPLNRVTFLVLDEADRMLDMGFEPQLEKIIPKTHKDRQSLMWSATWPKEVRSLANNYMKDYIQVNIGDDTLKANVKISQKVEVLSPREKDQKLIDLLSKNSDDKVIVFCNQKRTCDRIEYLLENHRINAAAIHGDKTQQARDTVINMFKRGSKNILIATDVAARGLDVPDVKLVINYDMPRNIEDYVHRIGRTARGSSTTGMAHSFFTDEDSGNASKLIDILKQTQQDICQELLDMKSNRSYGRSSRQGSSGFRSRSGYGRRFGY